MKKFITARVLALLLLAPQAHAVEIEWSCTSHYDGSSELDRIFNRDADGLKQPETSKYFIAGDRRVAPIRAPVYYASNESDWAKSYQKLPQVDIVAGVATNANLDLALWTNAKKVVFIDWSADPLVGMKFLVAPLFEIAESPAEFLSMIAGVPVPDQIKNGPLSNLFTYINAVIDHSVKGLEFDRNVYIARKAFVISTLTRLKNFPIEKQKFIARYLMTAIAIPPRSSGLRQLIDPNSFGPFDSQLSQRLADYYFFYNMRYNPTHYTHSLVDKNAVKGLYLTPFHSMEAFTRIKQLLKNAEYIHANLFDPGLASVIKKIGDNEGLKSYALNTSNVIDVSIPEGDPQLRDKRVNLTRETMQRMEILSSDSAPLQVFQTFGTTEIHQYMRYVLYSDNDIEKELQKVPH